MHRVPGRLALAGGRLSNLDEAVEEVEWMT